MNKNILSVLISVSLGVSSTGLRAQECPEKMDELNAEEIKKLPVKCLMNNDGSSSAWWWVAGGVAVAAGAGLALAGGGGGGGGGGDDHDDDFDDYDDYVEYYYDHGNWPADTPQTVIDRWTTDHTGTDSGTNTGTDTSIASGNDSFSSHIQGNTVTAFTYRDNNGAMAIDTSSSASGNNQYTSRISGNSISVTQNSDVTTTALNDATAININGNSNNVVLAGTATASGSDASVLDIEGSNNTVHLSSTSRVEAASRADTIDIEGYKATVTLEGVMHVSGADSSGIHLNSSQGSMTVAESASVTVSAPVNNRADDDVYAAAIDIDGSNFTLTQQSSDFYVGSNSFGIKADSETGGNIYQQGEMTITGSHANGIWLESERGASLTATNSGAMNASSGATAMYAQGAGASVVNTGEINVRNQGWGMSVANGATAINQGTITLSSDSGAATGSLIAMKATGTAGLVNDTTGIINLNASGATPFSSTTAVVNKGKIYANGSDVTQNYALNNYTIGTQDAGQAGVLFTSNAAVEEVSIDTGFTAQSTATTVVFDDAIVGNNLSGEENIRSTSVVWQAQGQKDEQGNIDVVMTKNAYDQTITDTSLTQAAQSLDKGYTNNALYNSLNQSSGAGVTEAIRQISGQNMGAAQMQARTLDYRFNQMSLNAVKTNTGLGFNVVSRDSLQGELGNDSRYDMLALTQDFTMGAHNFTLRYGIARIDGNAQSTSDSITDGYSQFMGLQHQKMFGEWQWQNQFDAALHQLETSRQIRYEGVSRTANASNEQQQFTLTSAMKKNLVWENGFKMQPFGGLRARYHHINTLNEHNAGDWNLNVDASEKTAVDALIGLQMAWKHKNGLALNATFEGGPNLHYHESNGYASLASSPEVRFAKIAQKGGGINSNMRVGASWATLQTQLLLNAYHWKEDGLKDKGLQFNLNYNF